MTGVRNKVDILLLSETKLDVTFPTRQFSIQGFTFGSCLLVYVRENMSSKLIKTELSIGRGFL